MYQAVLSIFYSSFKTLFTCFLMLFLLLNSQNLFAVELTPNGEMLNLTNHWVGFTVLILFCIAYLAVIFEEKIHMRKSKPVMLTAGLIWILIAVIYSKNGMSEIVSDAIRHNFLEYAELFFFLLVAMTYINAMMDRGVFDALRETLVKKNLSYRSIFWITGLLSFFISPIADNLTTALIMCAVIMAVSSDKHNFVGICCINIVVAANAGGAFSPFGDITTLMVWQKGIVKFNEFFSLFIPSLINWLIPAFIMQFFVSKDYPNKSRSNQNYLKKGGAPIVYLFLLTIFTSICFHTFLHIPPVFGMMTGLAYLKLYGYWLNIRFGSWNFSNENPPGGSNDQNNIDIFKKIALAEWDTLFFFYGIILCVGGIGFIGYLSVISEFMYGNLGPLNANIAVGFLSAIVDNIPVMFAVLSMNPEMTLNQWLLVTLTAGVGGSMLSIGSAAGVALMGHAKGKYTFIFHLKWSPVIMLGYFSSIICHILLNGL